MKSLPKHQSSHSLLSGIGGYSSARILLFVAILVQTLLLVYLNSSLDFNDDGQALLAQRMMSSVSRGRVSDGTVAMDEEFSACVLTMDDNHYLIEWIAYHFQFLPLRHLIVAVDPKSKTSPSHIFHRWRQRGLMDIEEWSDQDFGFNTTGRRWATVDLNIHRRRQKVFYTSCMKRHKEANRSWVTIIDVDEYVTLNTDQKQSSFASYLNQLRASGHEVPPCLMIPRLRYGAKESTPEQTSKNVPLAFNATSLLTMRHRYHAPLNSIKLNRFAKAIVDVSRVMNQSDLELNITSDTIHRPVKSICPDSEMTRTANGSSIVINHYLGTFEQFSFRNDARTEIEGRRTVDEYAMFKDVDDGSDDRIRPWLDDFVRSVGMEAALELLDGAGQVEETK